MTALSHRIGLLVFIGLVATCAAHGQNDRRNRTEPGLIVETGTPTAGCRELSFSPDGSRLFAAGDDKVVRIWRMNQDGFGEVDGLRWSIWKERRGSIYAMSISRDTDRIAIGGYGIRTGSVVVLNSRTGAVEHSLTDTKNDNNATVTALAISPDGEQVIIGTDDGRVWLWDLASGRANDVTRMGEHRGRPVLLVAFAGGNQMVSLARDGRLLLWNTKRPGRPTRELAHFRQARNIRFAELSGDGRWIAVAGETHVIEALTINGRESKTIQLPEFTFADSLSFDRQTSKLAVGVHAAEQVGFDTDHRVIVYAFDTPQPEPIEEFITDYTATALSFHPDGQKLATAGGPNHEVTLWNINSGESIDQVVGPGNCIWDVALSQRNGRFLGFRTERDDRPIEPNQRATGEWRVYDLFKRAWADDQDTERFRPVMPIEEQDGWTVRMSEKEYQTWYAVAPGGREWPIPLDEDRDGMPRCYTFLPAADGLPIRLAVGHSFGISVFSLGPRGPQRSRIFTGHQGEVMTLAPSHDFKMLISGSRDQTISAWSLAKWPSQSELGVNFREAGGKIIVDTVDTGGPGWESGLTKGDEILGFWFNAGKVTGGNRAILRRLQQPVPGLEFNFLVRRDGKDEPFHLLTTCRQRPVWRFFATRNREWVIWMARNYFYDTSTNGDFYIGWHMNSGEGDVDQKPEFYKAEQFRHKFHRKDVIDKLLSGVATAEIIDEALQVAELGDDDVGDEVKTADFEDPVDDTKPVRLRDLEPPDIEIDDIDDVEDVGVGADLAMHLNAAPRGNLKGQQLDKFDLWVNDYKYKSWDKNEAQFPMAMTVPVAMLRSGENRITFQGYNTAGGRADHMVKVSLKRPARKPNLHVLAIGIGDYRKSDIGSGKSLSNLPCTRRDAEMMYKSFLNQTKLYAQQYATLLVDEEATREQVLAKLDELAKIAKSDDCVVIFMAGHGDLVRNQPGAFAFCGPNYDRNRPEETGITSRDLYEALSKLPCRKVVFLDACHSGDTITNPIRSLTPGGKGPVMLAACDLSEFAFENLKYGHGLFTYAVLQSLDEAFARADKDMDQLLNPREIFEYVQIRIPEMLKEANREGQQNPISFPLEMGGFPVAQQT